MAPSKKITHSTSLNALVLFVCFAGTTASGLLGEGRARAQGVPTASIAVPTDKFSEKAASVLNHMARENLNRAGEFDLVPVREFLSEGASDPRLATYARAIEQLKSGKEQYDNLELDAAIDELGKSVQLFRKSAGRVGTGEKYLEALLYLGAAYILSGDNEQGANAFRTVALFDKRKVLDAKVFPPSMLEIFNSVKEEVAGSPVGTVLVKSNPNAAEVYLNGVFKGITPLTLIKVAEGTHFVRLEKDGFMPWGKMVDFYATHEETCDASLQPAPLFSEMTSRNKALLTDLEEDPPEKPLLDYGSWLRIEKMVVIKVTQRGDEVSAETALIQMAPPKRLAYRTGSFNLTSANFLSRADAFFSSLYRNVKVPDSKGSKKGDSQMHVAVARCNSDTDCSVGEVCDSASSRCIPYAPEADAFYEKWWFWVIVGGSLAVAGGTGVLVWYLLQPEEGAIEFTF